MFSKRVLSFLVLNVICSLVTVLIALSLWGNRPIGGEQTVCVDPTPVADLSLSTSPIVTDQVAPPSTYATPTPTTSQSADYIPTSHIVAVGETLGTIAEQYDVSMEAIMEANNLDDPNFISANQSLIIPVPGYEPPTAIPEPTAIPTEIPPVQLPIGETTLVIAAVNEVGQFNQEQLILSNTGPNTADLTGWTLSDDAGQTYTFPAGILLFGGGASITLHTAPGQNDGLNLYWNAAVSLWQSGKTAILRDAQGNIQATFTIP